MSFKKRMNLVAGHAAEVRSWDQLGRIPWLFFLGTSIWLGGAVGLAGEANSSLPGTAGGGWSDLSAWRPAAGRLIQAARGNELACRRLALLCDQFGPRLSGSTNLEAALDWLLAELPKDGFQRVRGEKVMVPHWVRGRESLELLRPRPVQLSMLGLGGSVGTPPEGITAEVLVVKSIDDLRARATEARGKIVLFNQPFTTYGQTLPIRSRGAIEAAKAGASASVIRSVTPFSMQTPHTGMMRYEEGVPRIPHAAVSAEGAALLQRLQDRNERLVLRLRMEARMLPDVETRNVIAEVPGREAPEEVVLVSGHIDSWDVGQGAMDDAGGCVAAWEAARLLLRPEFLPRRTVRLVFWANEENGLRGSRAYRTNYAAQLDRHVLAIESDFGVFKPSGFALSGGERTRQCLEQIARLLEPIQAATVTAGSSAADVEVLSQAGVPALELLTDRQRYFWYHHTEADTVDKVTAAELNDCVAALAVMAYVVAESPDRLPR